MANGIGNGGADPIRSEKHHDVRELEHRFRKCFREGNHRPALRFPEHGQSDSEENAEHHDLKDLSFGDRLGDVFGKDMENDVCDAFCLVAVSSSVFAWGGRLIPTPALLMSEPTKQ